MNLWLDVSPMRPSVYLAEPALRLTQAMQDQRVYREAVADVTAEAAATRPPGAT